MAFGMTNVIGQSLELKNTQWKSKSFWGYGNGAGSEIYAKNTPDLYDDFEFSIVFDSVRFVSKNLTLEQSDVRQIEGFYHVYANGFIKLEIDKVLCIEPNESCSLAYESDYTQIYKYDFENDGKIGFLNMQFRDSWIDKLVVEYLEKSENERIKAAKAGNYFIEWIPIETKKIKGKSYSVLRIVCEVLEGEKDFDVETYTNKYKELTTLYIGLPEQKLFEMNKKGKLEEWTF